MLNVFPEDLLHVERPVTKLKATKCLEERDWEREELFNFEKELFKIINL